MSKQVATLPIEPPVLSAEQFLAVIDQSTDMIAAIALEKQVAAYLKDRTKIMSVHDRLAASEWLKKIKGSQASCEMTRTSITKPINDLLRQINDRVWAAVGAM